MSRYLLAVNFEGGVVETPMDEWKPEEITAHLDYYRALHRELVESGELVQSEVLTAPDLAKIVTSDGTAPVVTDGPFQEFKEWLAGYEIVGRARYGRRTAERPLPPRCLSCPPAGDGRRLSGSAGALSSRGESHHEPSGTALPDHSGRSTQERKRRLARARTQTRTIARWETSLRSPPSPQ
jgi:hypothetical protein